MSRFDYLLDKIIEAPFQQAPFKHIEIPAFFSQQDFQEICSTPQVFIPPVDSTEALIDQLHHTGFKEITFPGTTTNIARYIEWHKNKIGHDINEDTCEGVGVTMRLANMPQRNIIYELCQFFLSPKVLQTLADKFLIDLKRTGPDMGLQKYLDGYEISPHPDIRAKALTYMININPDENSEQLDFHTHYMEFNSNKKFIQTYWEGNQNSDRCWVPWDWCHTVKQQVANNSAVFFAPDNNTLHAVKANYDHCKTQRTQFYGNLWYRDVKCVNKPNWKAFRI